MFVNHFKFHIEVLTFNQEEKKKDGEHFFKEAII